MSAFVCDDSTINGIVAGLEFCKNHGDYGRNLPKLSKTLAELMEDTSPREFGRMLYSMNVDAVEQRYPDTVGSPNRLPGQMDMFDNHLAYTYRSALPPQAVQLYKSLQCYLYQCDEGNVDELPLYKALDEFCGKLARHIVENSQAYDKANWG